jgi:hypothetical protein
MAVRFARVGELAAIAPVSLDQPQIGRSFILGDVVNLGYLINDPRPVRTDLRISQTIELEQIF